MSRLYTVGRERRMRASNLVDQRETKKQSQGTVVFVVDSRDCVDVISITAEAAKDMTVGTLISLFFPGGTDPTEYFDNKPVSVRHFPGKECTSGELIRVTSETRSQRYEGQPNFESALLQPTET